MTDDKKRILIVDDSTDDIQILMENLKGEYAIFVATNGEKALKMAARSPRPDLILMDVMMPTMDGYETCRRLKEDYETQNIDVIFVSAHDTTEEKLKGYDVGGTDYLIKPVQPDELMRKVALALRNAQARVDFAEQQNMAMQTTMTAISAAGEQGVVLDFMRRSFATDTLQGLAELIVESHGNFGLTVSVQLRFEGGEVHASTGGSTSPLEQELLGRLKSAGRLKESGSRLVANFGDITLLIKDMPTDTEKAGRLRDHVALLLEGAEARARIIAANQKLLQLVADSDNALNSIAQLQSAQKKTSVRILDDLMKDLENAFMSYGLTDVQEKRLVDLVQISIDRSQKNFETGLKIDEEFRKIIDRLTNFSYD